LKIINFAPIRSAVYIYKLFRQNLQIYDKISEKPHKKSQGKNFTSLFLSLIDLEKKNRLAYLLIWSQNHANQARFILFLIFVYMEGTYPRASSTRGSSQPLLVARVPYGALAALQVARVVGGRTPHGLWWPVEAQPPPPSSRLGITRDLPLL